MDRAARSLFGAGCSEPLGVGRCSMRFGAARAARRGKPSDRPRCGGRRREVVGWARTEDLTNGVRPGAAAAARRTGAQNRQRRRRRAGDRPQGAPAHPRPVPPGRRCGQPSMRAEQTREALPVGVRGGEDYGAITRRFGSNPSFVYQAVSVGTRLPRSTRSVPASTMRPRPRLRSSRVP